MNKIILLLIFIFYGNYSLADSITIQSTTSTRDSGLYQYLLPHYPHFDEVQIKVIAVGTGQAITNAMNCDGNILIVHDKDREKEFMRNGYGSSRYNLMYNDFVIVGPVSDTANIASSKSVLEVFSKIYNQKTLFISRSDSSGTHSAEMVLWDRANIDPVRYSGEWYLESGQGMGPSLNIAISLNAYILSDRSSWLRFNNKANHKILYDSPTELRNDYSMILVDHNRCTNLTLGPSKKLFEWLKSNKAADLIETYKINGQSVFYID